MYIYHISEKKEDYTREIGGHTRYFKEFLKEKEQFIDIHDDGGLDLYDFSNSVKKSRIKSIVNFCYEIGKKDKLDLIIPEKYRMKKFCEEHVIQKQILSPLINGRIWTLRHNIVVFKETDGTISLWIHKNGSVKLGIDEYSPEGVTSQCKLLDMLLTNSDYKNEREKGGKKIPKEAWAMPFVSYEHYEKLFTKMTIMYKEIFPKLIEYTKQFDKQYPKLNARYNEELDLSGNYCYQLLGVDLIFDKNDNPYVIEINDGPQVNYKSGIYHRFVDREIGGKEWRGEMLNDMIEIFIKAPLEKSKHDLPMLPIPLGLSFIKIGTSSDM